MARKIAVAIPKGGCGKTTTVHSLGQVLAAEHHQRVLFVDLDPQANLTQVLGFRPRQLQNTIFTAIKGSIADPRRAHIKASILEVSEGVDLVPANIFLNKANDEMSAALDREHILQRLLLPVEKDYDFILLDTLPYLGVLVNNALVAADEVLIPLQAESFAIESAALLLEHLKNIQAMNLNGQLAVSGLLLTMVDERTTIYREATRFARLLFGDYVRFFETEIRRTVRFSEAQVTHMSIIEYRPDSKGADSYRSLAREVLEHRARVPLQQVDLEEDFVEKALALLTEEGVTEDVAAAEK